MSKSLDPMLDVVFKLLVSSPDRRDLLLSLLNAVFRPEVPIESVELQNPELEKELVPDRGVVLDLRVQLQDGSHVNVEMQAQRRAAMRPAEPGLGVHEAAPVRVCVSARLQRVAVGAIPFHISGAGASQS